MPLDVDTTKFLEDAKKGKPRKFAMLCRGVKVLGLIVYKRGTEERYKKELKKEAKGQFYCGVISGKGEKITFELLREQCDKPPTKDLVLKEFINAESGLKFKPTFEVVDELTPISESDDDGVDLETLWKERATALSVNLKQLKQDKVDLANFPKLSTYAKGAQEFAKRKEYEKAHKVMDEVERLVAEALKQGRQSDAAEVIAPGRVKKQVYLRERWKQVPIEVEAKVNLLRPNIGDNLASEVQDALNDLIEQIDQSIQVSVDQGASDFGPAVVEIRNAKQQVQADELIRHLESHPTVSNVGVEAAFLKALDELEVKLAS